jgi:hypothetical protein
VLARAGAAAGGGLVRFFRSLDEKLEAAGALPKLEPLFVPKAVAGPDGGFNEECQEIRAKLGQLRLVDADVWAREEKRKQEVGEVKAPWYIAAPFWALCVLLDVVYGALVFFCVRFSFVCVCV